MSLKHIGTFEDLKNKLLQFNGEWEDIQPNKKVFRYNEGVLSWFVSTSTVTIQGKGEGKKELEDIIPSLLYPDKKNINSKTKDSACTIDSNISNSDDPTIIKSNTTKDDVSIEHQYLSQGINEAELILGIVSSVGTDTKLVLDTLINRLEGFNYEAEQIRVSELLETFIAPNLVPRTEYERIRQYMSAGDTLREKSRNNAILAAGVVNKISSLRELGAKPKKAYIINSLKHPDEVEFLRKIYGVGFYLIGIHADEKRRLSYLRDDKLIELSQAEKLIKIDEDEALEHGQKTRDTYHLSDFFLNVGSNTDQVKNHLQRYLDLIFSHPYKQPTFDEFAMFMAFNSSTHSADLSRQVGAVITSKNQIIATGANEVPQAGGGTYWSDLNHNNGEVFDLPDGKDYKREIDSNKQAQNEIIEEIINKALEEKVIDKENEDKLKNVLKKSKISDLTEFGRVVHAEMNAILSCTRVAVSTVGADLYCTTFPCHNCAKHIIASGIKRVVYVEPYPKSRALEFHSESIQLKTDFNVNNEKSDFVDFSPFIGVGPRRFLDLFSMSLGNGFKLKRKNKDGSILDRDQKIAPIRTPLLDKSYKEVEDAAINIWLKSNKVE